MKVAFVRGVHLNPFEFQLYKPLASEVQFTLIGARWQFYPASFSVAGMERKLASVLGDSLASRGPAMPFLINRISSRLLGQSFHLRDLNRLLPACDIYHSAETYHSMTYQCLQLKRQRGGRLVVTVSENIPGRGENHPIRRKRKQAVLREADMFIAISERTRQMLLKEGVESDRIEIIPMSIDLKPFQTSVRRPEIARVLRLKPDSRRVFFLGRLSPEKGIQDLLDAIPAVLQHVPNVQFVLIGNGPLESLVKKACTPDGSIILHRSFPYDDVPSIHREADLLVLPSIPIPGRLEEQFGFVLAEAMATGVPIVTTRVGAIPEVVGAAALLTDPHQPVRLSEAIVQALTSATTRASLIEEGKQQVQQKFDAETNARKILRLYQRLVECRS